jgi:SAM-dependent methyltransferase
LGKFSDRFLEEEVRLADLDGEGRLKAHAAVLKRKRILAGVFAEMNALFLTLEARYLMGNGARVELGAGVAPLRAADPTVRSSDVLPSPDLDLVVDAQQMPFANGEVKTLFGQNCFHHFPEPRRFFREVIRVVPPGGGVVLIEPYYGPLASALFKRMFASEGFDKRAKAWEVPAQGPMRGANQALSFLVFVRDRALFEREFPELEIVHAAPLRSYLRYLFSGGLNFRPLVPEQLVPALRLLEVLLTPFERFLALHHVIVLRRR